MSSLDITGKEMVTGPRIQKMTLGLPRLNLSRLMPSPAHLVYIFACWQNYPVTVFFPLGMQLFSL